MVLIVHHLHTSQSERVPWLCEELGLSYELKTYARAPVMAPPEYKALHPSGSAPVIQDTDMDIVLAESGACVEYIAQRFGDGKLFLPPQHKSYADFLYWFHWANGTFQPAIVRTAAVRGSGGDKESPGAKIAEARFVGCLRALEGRLDDSKWLAGDEFTAADVMVVFSLTTCRYFFQYSLGEYPGILGYLQRIGGREAYRRAMEKCDPGMELALGAEPPKGAKALYSK